MIVRSEAIDQDPDEKSGQIKFHSIAKDSTEYKTQKICFISNSEKGYFGLLCL